MASAEIPITEPGSSPQSRSDTSSPSAGPSEQLPEREAEGASDLEDWEEPRPSPAEAGADGEATQALEATASVDATAAVDPTDDYESSDQPEVSDGSETAGARETAGRSRFRAESPGASLRSLSLPAQLEAILYLKGRPVPLAELAEIAAIDRQEAELALITLMTDYAHRDTALEIRQEGQSFSLQLRDDLGDLVQTLIPVDLSTATLRTLATIALKQRILQSELVDLRGSGAYDHIKELLAQDFIERRRQSDGRSYWLSLSEKFHRTFAVQGLEPRLAPPEAQPLQLELDPEEQAA